ncbi:MAG: thiamine-phosphate kinase [Nitratireductor sp.]
MVTRLNEFSIIKKYFAPLSGKGAFDLLDDAALLNEKAKHSVVVTNDAICEGIHFLPNTNPKHIAQKALRTNLSDLCAKGAVPFGFTLALGLPSYCDEAWIKRFAAGLKADCKKFNLELVGGDTFKVPNDSGLVVSITAFGNVIKSNYASRLKAKAGHKLYVTGSIGDSVLGLKLAQEISKSKSAKALADINASEKYLINRYELPRPRFEGATLIAKYASAAMDISDGFVGDLEKLCQASNVAIEVEQHAIPLSKQAHKIAKTHNVPMTSLITGGDDYELLICVPKSKIDVFEKESSKLDLNFTCLGSFKKSPPLRKSSSSASQHVTILDEYGRPLNLTRRSYIHF